MPIKPTFSQDALPINDRSWLSAFCAFGTSYSTHVKLRHVPVKLQDLQMLENRHGHLPSRLRCMVAQLTKSCDCAPKPAPPPIRSASASQCHVDHFLVRPAPPPPLPGPGTASQSVAEFEAERNHSAASTTSSTYCEWFEESKQKKQKNMARQHNHDAKLRPLLIWIANTAVALRI